ncbi:nitrate reductase molybdenum cofactor assembly chaperone [Neobacillus dielmonensis]|uniref:nitrate reductase molybdenum cofactor assembly chaperone n=1 Tax=Neobacillus dielmonensis TaxID=1347369 RepID=UPI0005A72878|nr:nitrate reductase molybdenum cofactor assembly chaperone [Neobacillus dielmonensis]
MNHEDINPVFQYCSILLNYPDQDFQDILAEAAEEAGNLSFFEATNELQQFLEKARALSPVDLVSIYVNTFDFGKKTNLYVTYLTNGEQRERGMDLLFLKNYYKIHGFLVTHKELPDYLPVMLEFAGLVDLATSKPILERYYDQIKEIADHLDPTHNLYGHIFKAILLAMKSAGIIKLVRRSEEICSNNFYGACSLTLS